MRDKLLKTIACSVALAMAAAPAAFAASSSQPVLLVAQADAAPYLWSATKSADGTISLAGDVPSTDVRDVLTDGIDKLGSDGTKVTTGAPADFSANAVAALTVLSDLDSGVVMFDGTSWTISGVVAGADKGATAQAAFDESPLKAHAAAYKVVVRAAETTVAAAPAKAPPAATAPAASAATAAATTSPAYAWSADKAADGTITFTGDVPNAKLKGFLVTHVAGKSVDNSTVADGAPKDFVGGALYGLNALMALDSGKLSFADGKWQLSGAAKSDDAKKSAMGQLGVIDTKAWTFDIKAGAPAVAATPAPATAAPAATATAAPAPAGYAFAATKSQDGALVLTGDVPSAALKAHFSAFASKVDVAGLAVSASAPSDFSANAVGGLNALDELEAGQLQLADGKWSLKGNAPTPELRDSIVASLGKLPAGASFGATGVEGPPPLEYCRLLLAQTLDASAIRFDGRTPRFAKGSDAVLDTVAKALAICPDARVNVAGATDADGGADANMALSVARAEAVVNALGKRGIASKRLYAIGYGETLPLVAKPVKPADKAKNNRILITVDASTN